MDTLSSKRLVHLAIQLFNNADGKEFLSLLKKAHLETPVFPAPSDKLDRHGGAFGWASFREGNIDLIRKIELMSQSKDYLKEDKEKSK